MKMQREDHKMDKRSIFERGFAILLSVILMAACFPLSIFAEDTTQDPDFSGTNLMNLENVQPSGYTTTTKAFRVSKVKRATRVTKASKAFRVSKAKKAMPVPMALPGKMAPMELTEKTV